MQLSFMHLNTRVLKNNENNNNKTTAYVYAGGRTCRVYYLLLLVNRGSFKQGLLYLYLNVSAVFVSS